jgi:hypothetical protein
LLVALAQWVAGELFHRAAGAAPSPDGWSAQQAQPHIAPVERELKARFPRLEAALRGDGLTAKKALAEFPKWAQQSAGARPPDDELGALTQPLRYGDSCVALQMLVDDWMDRRSPRWLIGFRNIARSTDERSFISSLVPRAGVGHSLPLVFVGAQHSQVAALLGLQGALVFDYVVRQKLGGTNMTFGYVKQFPVLPPDRFALADLEFVVPRVLELSYTAYDLKPWADDLAAYDPRPAAERGRPFAWNPERRAQLRAALDAYYACLYGLTRDELRYILDPQDVMGDDYPSETFRVLKEGEVRTYGEYRTRRLVLEAWDRLVNS